MIKKIKLTNFFSFKEETSIELNPTFNILVGINGSGKTSFLNAIRLLYEGVAGMGFDSLFSGLWGGYDQVANFAGTYSAEYIRLEFVFDHEALFHMSSLSPFTSEVTYSITILPMGTSYMLEEKLFSQNKKKARKLFNFLDFRNGRGRISARNDNGEIELVDYNNENVENGDGEISGRELVLKQISDPKRFLPSHIIRKAIESFSLYGHFDVSTKSKLRNPGEFDISKRLKRNGENIAYLISYLKNNRISAFEKIEKALHEVNPQYRHIVLSPFSSKLYLSLHENGLEKTIGALHISDGTLRYLLLSTILCNPERGNIVTIDEPENGLHPDMIVSVAKMIKDASDVSQIIISTHSPLLLNQFNLEDLIVFEKNENNSSYVHKVKEDDFSDWEGDFLPGMMWMYGVIGGKRW